MSSSSTLILAFYFVLFASIHSLLADFRFKRLVEESFGCGAARWYRLFYTLFAAFTVLPLLYGLYLFPGKVLYVAPTPWRWIMVAGQALAALTFAKAFLETKPLEFFGIKPKAESGGALIVRGLYCRVRNPLFLLALIFIWLVPFMTVNLLVLYILATVYFYLGSAHEERMLAKEFGEEYLAYKKVVPRMIPRLRCRYGTEPDSSESEGFFQQP